jgi:ankyrin repeat protein
VAAENGKEAVVQLLLEHKVEIGARDNDGETPLHMAAKNGNEAVAQLLLEHKTNIDAKNTYGQTALHLCHPE